MASTGGGGAIAVILAYHYSNAKTDFNYFSTQFGLATETSANITDPTNLVLSVVYASGRQPRPNSGWSQEAALDIEWSHAMAPGAKIFLVEANSNSNNDLLAAVSYATTQLPGVTQISMSWGGSEFSGETGLENYFSNPNICYFAASGDTGGQIIWPSVSANVVAAGGTTLTFTNGSFSGESGWSGSGGGNSQFIGKPSFQINPADNSLIGGSNRSVPDLSSDADPNTGVYVRWNGGWYRFGGTSVASPCLAGMSNLCGATGSSGSFLSGLYTRYIAQQNHTQPVAYYDVATGAAGTFKCDTGWDFVTGVGSPRSTWTFGK
jgi:subtilase family serine protease